MIGPTLIKLSITMLNTNKVLYSCETRHAVTDSTRICKHPNLTVTSGEAIWELRPTSLLKLGVEAGQMTKIANLKVSEILKADTFVYMGSLTRILGERQRCVKELYFVVNEKFSECDRENILFNKAFSMT